MLPVKIISAHPQTTNEKCDLYNKALLACADHLNDCRVASISLYGLSTEHSFIIRNLTSFMLGLSNSLGFVDPNHAAKSLRS
jgi:hypothetical protein